MAITRASIIDALVARIQTISVAHGYHTALGAHAFSWLPRVIEPGELPAANVRDMDDSIAIDSAPFDSHMLSVEIDVAANGVAAIRQAVYDVYKAIGTDPTLGGLAIDTQLQGDSLVLDQNESLVVGATISIAVMFRTFSRLLP